MKKPYIGHQPIYPLDIFIDGKQIASYKPNHKPSSVDLKKAMEQAIASATAGLSQHEVIGKEVEKLVLPIVSENYADAVRQLFTGSYLYNPSFADDAQGWIIPENNVKLVIVDNKIRVRIGNGGIITQSNELIRKPPYHLIFEERPTEESGETQQAMAASETTQWESLEEVTINDKTRTEADTLHLKLTFNCISKGHLKIGFPESSQEEEWMLEYIERDITELGVQTIETSGIWDETGDFIIQFDEGEIEIMELSLTGNPLEEYQKQVNSAVLQVYDNLYALLAGWSSLRDRIYLIQEEITNLKNSDIQINNTLYAIFRELAALESTLEQQATDIASAVTLATEAKQTASYYAYKVEDLSTQLSSLDARVSALEQS